MASPRSAAAQATSVKSARERAGWWWALSLSALFAAFVYLALNWYTIEDDNEWVGMQGEALTNPYLAMQRTVEAMGASTQIVKGDDAWDTILDGAPKNATLLLGDRRLVRMTSARVDRIRQWVRAGGNLIVEAEQPKLDDPLLASYGIGHAGLRWTAKNGLVEKREQGVPADGDDSNPEDDGFGFNADDVKDQAEKNPPMAKALSQLKRRPAVSNITFADNARFKVDFRPYQNLRAKKVPDDADVIDDPVGTRMVQFRDGLGRVTAISNFDFMTWRTLGKYDHAEFLWHMIATQNVGAAAAEGVRSAAPTAGNPVKPFQPVILLALRDRGIGLWAWLGQHAWMVLCTLAVLLLVWIARVVPRFGPLRGDAVGARLNLGEHLRALGQYLARQQAWPTLAQAARERFLKRLYRERPGLSRVDRPSLLVALEKLTGMGLGRIQRALTAAVLDESSFIDTIRSLKSMEAMLDHRSIKETKRQNQPFVKA